jgi:hypothetical protein
MSSSSHMSTYHKYGQTVVHVLSFKPRCYSKSGKTAPWVIGFGFSPSKPVPVIPNGERISPKSIPMGINFNPYPNPNRGIPHG